jgi:ketosteroid isomerase-like protein
MTESDEGKALRQIFTHLEQAITDDPLVAADTFARYTDPDYIFTSPTGTVSNRSELVEALRQGAVKFSSYAMNDLTVRTYEDWAVVTGRASGDGINPGREIFHGDYRFTSVWRKTTNAWKLMAWQATAIQN